MGVEGDTHVSGDVKKRTVAANGEYVRNGENLAVRLCGIDNLKTKPFKLPSIIGDNEVRVRMKTVGVCGSDVHYVRHLQCRDFIVKEPMEGHECAGIVEESGKDVEHLVVGNCVALEPGISCHHCDECKEGSYNLCSNMRFFATPPGNWLLAQQVVHPADMCFKLHENVTLEKGAMCEPMSVGACMPSGRCWTPNKSFNLGSWTYWLCHNASCTCLWKS